jgi:pyruvate/2-oxoglutarate dehydrogenase complex dihydrolipoamide acyltransferase (E2) component
MHISAQVTGTLREWYYDVGAVVEADEAVAVLETEAITVEVLAPAAGRLVEMRVLPGDTVQAGDVLGRIEPQLTDVFPDSKPSRKKRSLPRTITLQLPVMWLLIVMAGLALSGIVAYAVLLPVSSTSRPVVTARVVMVATPTSRFDFNSPHQLYVLKWDVDSFPTGTQVRLGSTWYDLDNDTRWYQAQVADTGATFEVRETDLEIGPVATPIPTMQFDPRTVWSWFYPLELAEAVRGFPAGTPVKIVNQFHDGVMWHLTVKTESGFELNVTESQLVRPADEPANPLVTPMAQFPYGSSAEEYTLLTTQPVGHIPANTPVRVLGLENGFGEWAYRVVMQGDPRVVTARESELRWRDN